MEGFRFERYGRYHDLYLVGDVLLLTDVFENFRIHFLNYYKLDPCHYFTSPGLSWDAMLRMTGIRLELITDIDMYQFIEKGIRGGVSYIANRYGNGNNKYMKEYNEKVPSKYIMYLDANNLYGWAMIQYLPTGNFKWMTDKEIRKTNLGKYKADSKEGLILEVDLEYPKELHDLHNDYPIAPEKVKVSKNMPKTMKKAKKTAKGIKKNVIKNNIRHEDYKRTLLNEEQMHHKMKTIRSQRHQLGSYEINKISLSCFDDKRYIHDDGTSSYAHGHYKIK